MGTKPPWHPCQDNILKMFQNSPNLEQALGCFFRSRTFHWVAACCLEIPEWASDTEFIKFNVGKRCPKCLWECGTPSFPLQEQLCASEKDTSLLSQALSPQTHAGTDDMENLPYVFQCHQANSMWSGFGKEKALPNLSCCYSHPFPFFRNWNKEFLTIFSHLLKASLSREFRGLLGTFPWDSGNAWSQIPFLYTIVYSYKTTN